MCVGALGGLQLLSLPNAARSGEQTAKPPAGFGRAKSVILVFANGGQSQIDTWDPKPDAPDNVRGEFRPIATALPGVSFCEHLPQTAKVANHLTVVRSMSHEDLDHGSAVYLSLTGYYHARRSGNPSPSPNDMPTYGSVLRRMRLEQRFAHDAIHLNGPALLPVLPGPGQSAGLLGGSYEPLVVGDVVNASESLPGLALQVDLPLTRMDRRLELLRELDRVSASRVDQATTDVGTNYSQALAMLASPRARKAFNLDEEPRALRERYGRHRSGQAMLLARRLVEAGVPFVNVIWNHSNRGQDLDPKLTDMYGWDTHNDIFDALRDRLLPRFDQSFSALIEDLHQRGQLDETLVVCMGEFGRAPRIAVEKKFAGSSPGRQHWPTVYSIVLAGAGIKHGAIVGSSDRLGGEPASDRYGPWDMAATIFHALGISPERHYTDTLGRPFPASHGRPIELAYRV